MSKYSVEIKEHAQHDLNMLRKNDPVSYKKALALINELYEHPQTGTGKPEQLKGYNGEVWSRRISKKHRLIYEIFETEVHVDVLTAYGHYCDK